MKPRCTEEAKQRHLCAGEMASASSVLGDAIGGSTDTEAAANRGKESQKMVEVDASAAATTTDDDEDDGEEAGLGPPSSSEKVRSLRELLRRGVGQKFDLRAYV